MGKNLARDIKNMTGKPLNTRGFTRKKGVKRLRAKGKQIDAKQKRLHKKLGF